MAAQPPRRSGPMTRRRLRWRRWPSRHDYSSTNRYLADVYRASARLCDLKVFLGVSDAAHEAAAEAHERTAAMLDAMAEREASRGR